MPFPSRKVKESIGSPLPKHKGWIRLAQYIATFYTHFDAMDCSRTLKKQGVPVRLGPVPRALSSSCGTCAFFTCPQFPGDLFGENYEKVFLVDGENYLLVLENQE